MLDRSKRCRRDRRRTGKEERKGDGVPFVLKFRSGHVCLMDLEVTARECMSVCGGDVGLYSDDEAAVCSLPALFLCLLSMALSAFHISSAAVITRVESTI